MFRSISSNFPSNIKNIQYFGSTPDQHKRAYPSSEIKEINNVNRNIDDESNLISFEHLSETSSLIELVLPLTIFAITIIAVLFVAFILFVWIRKTFRENHYGREFVVKKKQKQEIKNKAFEQLCAGSILLDTTKKCEKIKSCNKIGGNKMNSRKWLRENTKQIVDNSAVVSDDLEQKLETVEFKSTPPNTPNSQKELQENDDDCGNEEAAENYENVHLPTLSLSDDEQRPMEIVR